MIFIEHFIVWLILLASAVVHGPSVPSLPLGSLPLVQRISTVSACGLDLILDGQPVSLQARASVYAMSRNITLSTFAVVPSGNITVVAHDAFLAKVQLVTKAEGVPF